MVSFTVKFMVKASIVVTNWGKSGYCLVLETQRYYEVFVSQSPIEFLAQFLTVYGLGNMQGREKLKGKPLFILVDFEGE